MISMIRNMFKAGTYNNFFAMTFPSFLLDFKKINPTTEAVKNEIGRVSKLSRKIISNMLGSTSNNIVDIIAGEIVISITAKQKSCENMSSLCWAVSEL